MPTSPFVKADAAPVWQLPHCQLKWLVHGEHTPSQELALGLATFPKGGGHGRHRHPNAEEFIYVVQGTARQGLEDQESDMAPGDCIHIPKNAVHFTKSTTDGELVIMVGFSHPLPETVDLE